ncbi:MAG: UDP-N-acetylmuramoyl-L-alanyl-D-glutamate--2,6-diaminopimelate ligase [Clostridia bacterium]
MLLSILTQAIPHKLIGRDADIKRIEYDSRHVKEGDLFCCVSGTFSDGHKYAREAIEKGASALLCEHELPFLVPQIIVENTRVAMAETAARFYKYPSREMTIVGVTGTNGKTTTTYMLKSIFEHAGKKVGLIGTIKNMIGSKIIATERTTPESVELQELLRRMADEDVDIVVMEVSSHSLVQGRVHGVHFAVGEFTNLTQDHLDYHKTFENYFQAKKILFYNCDKAIVNADDPYAKRIIEGTDCEVLTFGISKNADIYAKDIDITTSGVQFTMHKGKESILLSIPIPGLFSVSNALGAVGVAMSLGISLKSIKAGLEEMMSVAGRFEPLSTGGRDYTVFLDYAHAPDAVENVLKTVKEFSKGRIVTLFGCGGDRDRAKRPIMGEIAGRHSDFLIVTSDNPRTEEPISIIDMIMVGVKKSGCEYIIIEDRRKAIEYALNHAKKDDCIVLAGKGHENYQEINGIKNHFDEKEIVAEILGTK